MASVSGESFGPLFPLWFAPVPDSHILLCCRSPWMLQPWDACVAVCVMRAVVSAPLGHLSRLGVGRI